MSWRLFVVHDVDQQVFVLDAHRALRGGVHFVAGGGLHGHLRVRVYLLYLHGPAVLGRGRGPERAALLHVRVEARHVGPLALRGVGDVLRVIGGVLSGLALRLCLVDAGVDSVLLEVHVIVGCLVVQVRQLLRT